MNDLIGKKFGINWSFDLAARNLLTSFMIYLEIKFTKEPS
jgi:hypothetical protein